MKYIRTNNGIYEPITDINSKSYNFKAKDHESYVLVSKSTIVKQADNLKDLIMVGDLVVWYSSNSKRDEYFYIHNEDELFAAIHYPIKQVFMGTEFGYEFILVMIANEQGELELL